MSKVQRHLPPGPCLSPSWGPSEAQATGGSRSAARPHDGRAAPHSTGPATSPPDPEVPTDRPKRRTFTAEYKKRILEEADACSAPGTVGVLLRREGLFSSHLTEWRRQREQATVAGLAPKKRGRKQKVRRRHGRTRGRARARQTAARGAPVHGRDHHRRPKKSLAALQR